MREKIGIISTIVIVSIFVIFAISQESILIGPPNTVSDDLVDIVPDDVCISQCSENNSNNFSVGIVLLEIPLAFGIAAFVWYLTTKMERKNRKYIRNIIGRNYLGCLVIVNALLNDPSKRNSKNKLLDSILTHYAENIRIMNIHSHLLNANEMVDIEQQEVVVKRFISSLRQDPNNIILLKDFANFIKNVMSEYITNYKIKTFYEYVN